MVDAELRHLLKRDCFLDAADEGLRHLMKMDCFLDEVQELMELPVLHRLLRGLLLDRQPHVLQLLLY